MPYKFSTKVDSFNVGYRIGEEDTEYLNDISVRPRTYSVGDLPERVDPRLHDLYKEGWLRTENQGSIGSCLPGNSLITLADGSQKMIKHIRYGDYVLSHTRTPRRVVDTMSRDYTGKMYEFHVKGWKKFKTTADHIILVKRNQDIKWVRADEVLDTDFMLVSAGVNESPIEKLDLTRYLSGLQIFEEDDIIRSVRSTTPINRYLELDELTCYCIGLYVAEGSCDYSGYGSPVRSVFTLHQKEEYLYQRLKEWGNKLGIRVTKTNKNESKAINVRFNSGILASFLKNVCGNGCNRKEIPNFVLCGSETQRKAFLQGYLDGDGHYSTRSGSDKETLDKGEVRTSVCNQVYCSTASKKLQIQLAEMMVGFGMKPGLTVTKIRAHQNYDSNAVYLYSNDAQIYCDSEQQMGSRKIDQCEWGQWRKIRSITTEDVKLLDVYDLTVEVDHSFITEGVAVHNCQGASLTECLEFCIAVETNKVMQFSKMFAYLTSQMENNIRSDSGSTLSGGTRAIAKKGCCTNEIAPYPNRYPGWGWITQEMEEEAKKYKLKSASVIKAENEVRDYIGSGIGIVHIGIAWGRSMTPNSQGCIKSFSPGGGGHAINLAGYVPDEDVGVRSTKGYWYLMKNSWGTRWGKGGFAYVDPRAVSQMLGHRWTVMLGRSDLETPEPRRIDAKFTDKDGSFYG